jgi:branched-chain amino acid transport system ATP-binding protein
MNQQILELNDVHTYYGESHVLQGVSFHVAQGECVSLIGTNGMGKTTTMLTIMGLTRVNKGSILLEGKNITHMPPYTIARRGIGYVPEDRAIFDALTTLENLKIPYLNTRRQSKKTLGENLDYIYTLFPRLQERRNQLAGKLSGGEQQMLTIARGLITGTKILLLDESFKGLAPSVVQSIIQVINKVKEQNHTILMVEEKISIASEVADRFYFLKKGRITAEESVISIRNNPGLFYQYLGIRVGHS